MLENGKPGKFVSSPERARSVSMAWPKADVWALKQLLEEHCMRVRERARQIFWASLHAPAHNGLCRPELVIHLHLKGIPGAEPRVL